MSNLKSLIIIKSCFINCNTICISLMQLARVLKLISPEYSFLSSVACWADSYTDLKCTSQFDPENCMQSFLYVLWHSIHFPWARVWSEKMRRIYSKCASSTLPAICQKHMHTTPPHPLPALTHIAGGAGVSFPLFLCV